jgi:hypothetical protein
MAEGGGPMFRGFRSGGAGGGAGMAEEVSVMPPPKDDLPMYLLNCHGCMCTTYSCNGAELPLPTGKNKSEMTKFIIPEDTYIIAWGTAGEYTNWDESATQRVIDLQTEFRKYLSCRDKEWITSFDPPDAQGGSFIPLEYNEEDTIFYRNDESAAMHQYPFLVAAKRAGPRQEYPDVLCFFDGTPQEKLGILNLESGTLEKPRIKTQFLSDVIRSKGPGIFISTGCTSPNIFHVNALTSYDFIKANDLIIGQYGALVDNNDLAFNGDDLPISREEKIIMDINCDFEMSSYSPLFAALTAFEEERETIQMRGGETARANLIFQTIIQNSQSFKKHPGETTAGYVARLGANAVIRFKNNMLGYGRSILGLFTGSSGGYRKSRHTKKRKTKNKKQK